MIPINPSAAEIQTLLRTDFSAFIERCFYHLNPSAQFLMNSHIEVIAAKLEDCRQGRIRRLIITLPPRSLKSLCASVAFPSWLLGQDPAGQVLCVSYGQELTDKFARDCRNVMNSGWYQRLFTTRLSPQKQSTQEFVTTDGGYRMGTSVGGVLTGRGADFIIVDDPMKPSEALSDALRRGVNEWFDHTLFSRLNDKRTGRIIIIMQRLHEDDPVGHVLERGGWEVVSFPAIAEQEEEHVIHTPYGQRRFVRRAGEALHPEREPLEVLAATRATIGEYNFASQYQQAPVPLGGGMVKKEWFRSYAPGDLPARFDQIVQSWDTANKPSELNDFSVGTTWGVSDGRIYLLHVLRKRMDYPNLKRTVREQAELHDATVVLIEDQASGTHLIQELVDEGMYSVTRYAPEGNKQMRMHAQTATIENGFVYLPREASWLQEYIHELTTFPYGKFDDQVDSTSQALDWIKQASRRSAFWKYIDHELTLARYRAGNTAVAIAEELRLPIERVEGWIAEEQQKPPEQEGLVALERLKVRLRQDCPKCGKEIVGDFSVREGQEYHPGCR